MCTVAETVNLPKMNIDSKGTDNFIEKTTNETVKIQIVFQVKKSDISQVKHEKVTNA